MHDCLIAFGSNEGNRREVFQSAVVRLDQSEGVRVSAKSKIFQTAPVGGPKDQDAYLNAALRVQTSLDPIELHKLLVQIETDLGRFRRRRWGSRKIDLDLLLYDQQQLKTAELIVPHPRMSFRRFVLEPACEIAPNMVHRPSGRTLGELVSHLDERDELILCICQQKFENSISAIDDELKATSATSKFEFQVVKDMDRMNELQTRAKLVTYVNAEKVELNTTQQAGQLAEQNSSLWSAAVSFPGPTLELPDDPEQAMLEISAAIEAMAPLRNGSEQ